MGARPRGGHRLRCNDLEEVPCVHNIPLTGRWHQLLPVVILGKEGHTLRGSFLISSGETGKSSNSPLFSSSLITPVLCTSSNVNPLLGRFRNDPLPSNPFTPEKKAGPEAEGEGEGAKSMCRAGEVIACWRCGREDEMPGDGMA